MRAQEHNPAKHMLVASWNFSIFPSSPPPTQPGVAKITQRPTRGKTKVRPQPTKCWEGGLQGLPELPCSPRYHVASAECVGDILPMSSLFFPS